MLAGLLACASPRPAEPEGAGYVHDRRDYAAFRERHSGLLEPNYLPFMAHRLPAPEGAWSAVARRLRGALGLETGPPEELLVLCRWPRSRLPLRVRIVPPEIARELEDEFDPRRPGDFVRAVERALAIWERDLAGRIRFERVGAGEPADLTLRVLGEEAPVPDSVRQVLGSAATRDACRVEGGDPESGRLRVRFEVEALRIYVADRHGLLLPDQVRNVALHELGHALGMRGHSPVPADLMFRVVRDRLGPYGLGEEDVNSFLSLYALPSGTIYARPERAEAERRRPPAPPEGPPRLSLAPHVDTRLGFEIQTPAGWQRLETPYGVVAVDGVSWDYEASLEIVVRRYPDVETYLARYGPVHLQGRHVLAEGAVRVAGLRGRRFLVAGGRGMVEEHTFLETGDGRVVVAIEECPMGSRMRYRAWFDAALASLEIRSGRQSEPFREYDPKAPAERRDGAAGER